MDTKLTIAYSYTWEELYNDMVQLRVWTLREALNRIATRKLKRRLIFFY